MRSSKKNTKNARWGRGQNPEAHQREGAGKEEPSGGDWGGGVRRVEGEPRDLSSHKSRKKRDLRNEWLIVSWALCSSERSNKIRTGTAHWIGFGNEKIIVGLGLSSFGREVWAPVRRPCTERWGEACTERWGEARPEDCFKGRLPLRNLERRGCRQVICAYPDTHIYIDLF